MKILTIVGARPQFIKAATGVSREIRNRSGIREVLVHTGQYFDVNMSDLFFSADGNPEAGLSSRGLRRQSRSHDRPGRWLLPSCIFPWPMWRLACAVLICACPRKSTACWPTGSVGCYSVPRIWRFTIWRPMVSVIWMWIS